MSETMCALHLDVSCPMCGLRVIWEPPDFLIWCACCHMERELDRDTMADMLVALRSTAKAVAAHLVGIASS